MKLYNITTEDFVKCKTCKEEWQKKALFEGECPRCRGLLPKQAVSEAMVILTNEFDKLQRLNLNINEISYKLQEKVKELNLFDKNKLLKCNKCGKYDLTMNIIEGELICDDCYVLYYKSNN